MKKIFFAVGVLFSISSFSQQNKAVVNVKTFNFNLTNKIPSSLTNLKTLGGRIGVGGVCSLIKYQNKNTEHLVVIPDDTIPGPQLHFIKKNDQWIFENYYTSFKMDGARSYSIMDSNTFVYSSHGNENVQTWQLGDVVVVKTIGDSLTWNKISIAKGHYDNCSSGDINNDGLIDVITMHMGLKLDGDVLNPWTGISGMIPFTQNADGTFSQNKNIISDPSQQGDNTWPGSHHSGAILVAKLLGNQRPEIIIADYGSDPRFPSNRYSFAIFKYNESISKYQFFKTPTSLGAFSNYYQGATSMKSADFNNDGKLDIAVGTEGKLENGKPGGVIQVWINKGNGDFVPDMSIVSDADSNGFREFEVADVNKDGWNDIVLNGGGGYVARGNNSNGFYINLGPSIWLNNKGKLEPFLENLQINKYSVPLNIGGPRMSPVKPFFVNGTLSFIGFQPTCNLSGCNIDTTNNFNLYEATVTFCDKIVKPTFNTTKYSFCNGDSVKLSITNINKGDSLKWYYGTKSDLTNLSNKTFTDSTKLFVTRTDSLGCMISSDTINLIKYSIPSAPFLSKDTTNHLISSTKFRNIWYKDGTILSDTTQQISLLNNGYYTVKTMENNCISPLSVPYYYSSSFGKQQFVVKLKTYNFDVTNKNVTDSIHLNNALVRGQMVLYNVGKTQHLILNPNDRYYFPGYHFINKDGNWKFENMYNSLKMEGPYGYSIYDSLGNIAISSTGDEGRTVFGELFSVKTSGDSLIANKISLDKRPYSDVSTSDINQDGLMDIVTYGGIEPDNFVRVYLQQGNGSFINTPSIMPSSAFYIGQSSLDYGIQKGGYAITASNLYGDKYPQIIRGQYSTSKEARFGIAIHSFNERSGVYDYLKLISTLGVYQDTILGTTSIRVADLNNDGKKDFVIKYETPTGNLTGLQLFMNDGNNNFFAGQSFTFPPNKWNDGGFVLADVNKDGWVDILFSPISGTDFYINSSQLNDNTLGVKLQNSILLNNMGTFDFLKIDLSVFGSKPIYLKSNFINNQIKYVGFGFPDGNNGNPVLTAPSGAIKMYDFTVTFCNNLIKPSFNKVHCQGIGGK